MLHAFDLQPWITPSLFDNTGDARIVDEYTFGEYQSKEDALAILTKHWATWITEADFKAIADAGSVKFCPVLILYSFLS